MSNRFLDLAFSVANLLFGKLSFPWKFFFPFLIFAYYFTFLLKCVAFGGFERQWGVLQTRFYCQGTISLHQCSVVGKASRWQYRSRVLEQNVTDTL